MIVGLDTRGHLYLILHQQNTNNKIIEIFMYSLVKKLDEERPQWRSNTVVMLDNASYHSSSASLKIFEKLAVPILFTGPHSYSACRWFSLSFI